MDKVIFDKYVEERYNDQMEFYDEKSKINQKKYRQYQWVLIILSALTPVLAALAGKSYKFGKLTLSATDLQFTVVTISAIVAILTSVLKTFNYQELWINYRSAHEKLKPEIYYYNFSVGPYAANGVDKESLFVTRVEALLDSEHKQWPPAKKAQEDQDKPKDEKGATGATVSGSAADTENVDAEAQSGTVDVASETEPQTADLPSETQPESADVTEEVQSGVTNITGGAQPAATDVISEAQSGVSEDSDKEPPK